MGAGWRWREDGGQRLPESSLAAFVLAGAAGVVCVAFGEEQQARVGLCVQTAPAFLERGLSRHRALGRAVARAAG